MSGSDQAQIKNLSSQNQCILRDLNVKYRQNEKLNEKYEKSLKQLALLIKANQSLKKDFDKLQQEQQKIVQARFEQNKRNLHQFIQKQLQKQNKVIQNLSIQNEKLQIQRNTFNIRVNTLQMQKNKINKEKQQISKKYFILKAQIDSLDPQTRNNNNNIKENQKQNQKNEVIDELKNLIKSLQEQNNMIMKNSNIQNIQNTLLKQKYESLKIENKRLKSEILIKAQNQKIINELTLANQKMSEQKQALQILIQKLKNQLSVQPLFSILKKNQFNSINQPQQDLINILKQLHSQLGPLRKQINILKKQQNQKNIINSRDKASFEIKIIKLQKQIQFYKQHNELLKKQSMEIKTQKQLVQDLKKKISQIEQQKNILEGTIIVMQSLSVTDRTRVGPETYNTLKQFEKRIEILLQDSTLFKDLQGNHLQQLIAMKAYILQLDQRLKQIGQQNLSLMKKYNNNKQKIFNLNIQMKQIQNASTTKFIIYKQKIASYDKLVQKLTSQLERNIKLNQQQSTNQNQFDQVVNLYEEKMINMGEEIVRIRKDNQFLEQQIKGLRLTVNRKIRQLNDKQRDIVIIKTQNINLINKLSFLEKEILQKKFSNYYYRSTTDTNQQALQKSRIFAILQQQNRLIKARYQDQFFKTKELYSEEIQRLRLTISQLQKQVYQFKCQKTKLNQVMNNSHIKRDLTEVNKKLQYKIIQLQKIIKLRQIKIQQNQSQLKQIRKYSIQNLNLNNLLQKQRDYSRQLLNETKQLKTEIKNYQDLLKNKQVQISQLQKIILKNNYEIQEIKMSNKERDLKNIQTQHLRTASYQGFIQQNNQVQSLNYELNVKISEFQSTIFNLKLENDRLKGQLQIIDQKNSSLQTQIRVKNTKINTLQTQIRMIQNNQDSRIMANQSLIRSYQNQIHSLKYRIQQINRIYSTQKQKQNSRIKQIQKSRQTQKRVSQSILFNDQSQQFTQKTNQIIQNLQNYNKNLILELKNKQFQIQSLKNRLQNLQQKLRNTNQEIEQKIVSIKKLETDINIYKQNIGNLNIYSLSKISQTHNQNQGSSIVSNNQEIQILNSQILNLRTTIIQLNDKIQQKQSNTNELKHQIYALKLQIKRIQKYQEENHKIKLQLEKLQKQQIPINQNRINYNYQNIESQLTKCRQANQQFKNQIQKLKSQQSVITKQYKEQILILQNIIQYNKEKQIKMSQQMTQQLERLRNINSQSQSQRCKVMAQQISNLAKGIEDVKIIYQEQISSLKIHIKNLQTQIKLKNDKIQDLSKRTTQIDTQIKNQQKSDILYLVSQVQRLTIELAKKQKEISNSTNLISQYQSQKQRHKQNLALIVILFVQIQSLRNQLQNKQNIIKLELEQAIKKFKTAKATNLQQVKANMQLIKQLECSHLHLIRKQNLQKFVHETLSYQTDNNLKSNKNNLQLKSNYSSVLQSNYSNNESPSKMTIGGNSYKYQNTNSNQTNRNQYLTNPPVLLTLGSYGKISESHNMQSSYGNSSVSSSFNKNQNYNYPLKNVSMTSSIGGNSSVSNNSYSNYLSNYPTNINLNNNSNTLINSLNSESGSASKINNSGSQIIIIEKNPKISFKKPQYAHKYSNSLQNYSDMESTYYWKQKV